MMGNYIAAFGILMQLLPLILKAIPIVKQVAQEFGSLSWDEKFKKALELLDKLLSDAGDGATSQSAKNTAIHLAHLMVKNGAA